METLIVNGQSTSLRLKKADRFFSRLHGWLFHTEIHDHDALLISPCNSVHTFGMRFCIDVAFINTNNEVTKIVTNLKPNRSCMSWSASQCIEFKTQTIQDLNLRLGDILTFREQHK